MPTPGRLKGRRQQLWQCTAESIAVSALPSMHRKRKAEVAFTIHRTELCLNIVTHAQKAVSILAAGIAPKQLRRILKSMVLKAHGTLKRRNGGLEGNDTAEKDSSKLAYWAPGSPGL